jgi:hypothetical protein
MQGIVGLPSCFLYTLKFNSSSRQPYCVLIPYTEGYRAGQSMRDELFVLRMFLMILNSEEIRGLVFKGMIKIVGIFESIDIAGSI